MFRHSPIASAPTPFEAIPHAVTLIQRVHVHVSSGGATRLLGMIEFIFLLLCAPQYMRSGSDRTISKTTHLQRRCNKGTQRPLKPETLQTNPEDPA